MSYVFALIAVIAVTVHYGYPSQTPSAGPVIPSTPIPSIPTSIRTQGSTVYMNSNISLEDCKKPSFRNSTSCYWAKLNGNQSDSIARKSPIEGYTKQFLCRENHRKEQNGNTTQHPRSRRATTNILVNPCSHQRLPHSVTLLMAEDDTGQSVELYHDIHGKTFQTFYIRDCDIGFRPEPGYKCSTIRTAFDAPVWIDDGDGNYTNDKVEIKTVLIDTDCALHRTD